MILSRQVFQVEFGHMDEVLGSLKALAEAGQGTGLVTRVLTDVSGPNFTLVLESEAESLDAFWNAMQAAFQDPRMQGDDSPFAKYIESGHREFYTIEWEAG